MPWLGNVAGGSDMVESAAGRGAPYAEGRRGRVAL